MNRRIAAGLLSLTFVAACSDDPDRPSRALPLTDRTTSPEVTVSAGPSAEAGSSVATTAPVATSRAAGTTPTKAPVKTSAPASAAAPQKAQPKTAQTTQAAPRASSAPTQTTTKAPAPQPAPTRSSAPAPAPAPAGQFALTIRDFTFSPRILNVPVGSTVTATNQDEATHDWTSSRGVWGSGDLQTGQTFSFTFRNTGTFDYVCERHPQMTGTVNVT